MHTVDRTFSHQSGIRALWQENSHGPTLGFGGLTHGLTGGGKPVTRHWLGTDAQEKEALHGGFGNAMD
jgi:hypothetical protein